MLTCSHAIIIINSVMSFAISYYILSYKYVVIFIINKTTIITNIVIIPSTILYYLYYCSCWLWRIDNDWIPAVVFVCIVLGYALLCHILCHGLLTATQQGLQIRCNPLLRATFHHYHITLYIILYIVYSPAR